MANTDLTLAALGLAIAMITWGLDKSGFETKYPNGTKILAGLYFFAGAFWLVVAVVVFFSL